MIKDRASLRLDTVVVVGHGLTTGGTEVPGVLSEVAEQVRVVNDTDAALGMVAKCQPQLVIVRESISSSDGLSILAGVKSFCPQAIIVVVAEPVQVECAVKFVKAGAKDYMPGPLNDERLQTLLSGLKTEFARAGGGERFFCDDCPADVPIVGQSVSMVKSLETIRLVAQSRCNPVLILGETGTGKELAARAIHAWRCGEADNFVAVNCAALTANLLESELFGHTRGAFTGADREKTGLFEFAGRGTIFLDEISEMPMELQAKLLRVLQERTFRKVGGTKDIPCHATVITSSNRDLAAESANGKFRKDLYYRLAIFPITLAPLRNTARRGDVPLLAEFFMRNSDISSRRKLRGLTKSAVQKLMSHDWPGNVRELRNIIDRAIIVESGDQISHESIMIECNAEMPTFAALGLTDQIPVTAGLAREEKDFSLETAEREFILRALTETGWQRTRAASLLGITRATLHAKLKRYDIQAPNIQPATTSENSRLQEVS